MIQYGRFLGEEIQDRGGWLEVADPEDGTIAGRVRTCGPPELDTAVEAARDAFAAASSQPAYLRAGVLERAASILEARAGELAETIRLEAGKPILLARAEVGRAVSTIRMTANLVREPGGAAREMDGYDQGRGLTAITRRFPVGPVLAITPFNFPVNLAVHKVAPAVGAGCPVIHKPARKTPLSACILAEAFREAGVLPGSYQVVVTGAEAAERMAADDRLALLTFTGSAPVGWRLKALCGRKRTVLERGGDAAAIVERDADLARAASEIAVGAFAYAGQVCISVQRILVASAVLPAFRALLAAAIRDHVRVGRTGDPAVLVGPMISPGEADRVVAWVEEAIAGGARSLTGPVRREGNTVHPVILEDVPAGARVSVDEVFGPVATLTAFDSFEEAVAMANASRFGLQAGVFTSDLGKAMYAFEHLEVGGVVINDAPTRRVDHMPYGGVKESGEGREGPQRALEHMTEERLLLIQR